MDWMSEEEPIKNKDFMERLIELVKDDKELHDATVRLINSMATLKEAQAKRVKQLSSKRKGDL